MAGFFQQFLRGAVDGFLGSPNLKDYKHASKTFTTNAYQNAPKFKWLFHVYFDINKYLISDSNLLFPETINHGLLVKTIDLPRYQIKLEEMNQYNRKRYVQTKINYEPIKISFHDDNANQIRNLWHAYYSYYYNDPKQPYDASTAGINGLDTVDSNSAATALNNRNMYDPSLVADQRNWGYYSEGGQKTSQAFLGNIKTPFFKSIKIYGFNQHNFALYQLINPMIENFSHDTYNYNETTGIMENTMSVKYETVKYFQGAINGMRPEQIVEKFGEAGTYDTELSPIARTGTNASILGQGGLVDSVQGILYDLDPAHFDPLSAIQTAGRLSRTFKNSQQILQTAKQELVREAISAVVDPASARSRWNLPAYGSNAGPGGQLGNSTNAASTTANSIRTPDNDPIPGNGP